AEIMPLTVEVHGSVIGDVRLLPASGNQRIELKDFDVTSGVVKEEKIESDRQDMELAVASQFPAYLKVTLGEGRAVNGKKQWPLQVAVPKDRAEGRLPRESHILLTMTVPGAAPRGIRIPVVGHATFGNR